MKAERALSALQQLSIPTAVVLRDGQRDSVPASSLVPGDIVLLEEGNCALFLTSYCECICVCILVCLVLPV